MNHSRRNFLRLGGLAGAGLAATSGNTLAGIRILDPEGIRIDPEPTFELSPHLYMQFMEPLGRTDGSVEASWDFTKHSWREDLIEATQDLAPGMVRWGGIFTAYYRWREAVGPRDKRIPMENILWGGIESNQIGTAEFVDFCRQVKADPLMCVNFDSEGSESYATDNFGSDRRGNSEEAAQWVDYCNNPDNKERKSHGSADPLTIPYWQLGNETSYGRSKFDLDTAIRKTIEFSKSMRKVDPSIKIIGWGGRGGSDGYWAKKMAEEAGEHIDYVAFHHMFDPYRRDENSPLRGIEYRKDPDLTWSYLMDTWKTHEEKILAVREQVESLKFPLAMTECHYSFNGRNRNEVLSTWAAGVSYARMANVHERNGDLLKIATMADFCGTRWQVNAIMIPIPRGYGPSFLMPVAKVMRLYRKHSGTNYCKTIQSPDYLDITASRTDDTIFLHVINTERKSPVKTRIMIEGEEIESAVVHEIAGDPEFEVIQKDPDPLMPVTKPVPAEGEWTFPGASVSAVEIKLKNG
jgi:alpha-L-arabinofuranosidase